MICERWYVDKQDKRAFEYRKLRATKLRVQMIQSLDDFVDTETPRTNHVTEQ